MRKIVFVRLYHIVLRHYFGIKCHRNPSHNNRHLASCVQNFSRGPHSLHFGPTSFSNSMGFAFTHGGQLRHSLCNDQGVRRLKLSPTLLKVAQISSFALQLGSLLLLPNSKTERIYLYMLLSLFNTCWGLIP